MKEIRSENDFIHNPKLFFEKPFTRLETGLLLTPPTVDLLKFLPTLVDEAGLFLIKNNGTQ